MRMHSPPRSDLLRWMRAPPEAARRGVEPRTVPHLTQTADNSNADRAGGRFGRARHLRHAGDGRPWVCGNAGRDAVDRQQQRYHVICPPDRPDYALRAWIEADRHAVPLRLREQRALAALPRHHGAAAVPSTGARCARQPPYRRRPMLEELGDSRVLRDYHPRARGAGAASERAPCRSRCSWHHGRTEVLRVLPWEGRAARPRLRERHCSGSIDGR